MDFAPALRDWRHRRRVSQLELALRAGTTQRHVSFIERGRSAPGRAMVVRLAESLDIPLRERNALLLAAGYAPAYPERGLDDPELATVREALERVMTAHMPYPAVVVDRAGDLMTANGGFWWLVDDVAPTLLVPPVNVARVLLHPEGLAPRIVNFADWAHHVVDGLREQARRNPDPRLDALLVELTALAGLPAPGPDHAGFAVPLRLRVEGGELELLTTLTHFGTATDVTVAELRMEAFLPADAATADALAAGQHGR